MKDPKTRSREITSLLCAMEELGLGTGKIITLDEEKILKEGDRTVEIISAWKYLLGQVKIKKGSYSGGQAEDCQEKTH